ncbi:MAG: hypothetical protein LZF60_260028 [Nitrospira sp.]|nr:MAG: hypothetical protein LZF60_260028 [Nitrospira sp.]
MDSHCRVDRRAVHLSVVLLVSVTGCSEAVLMTQESERGGIMTYSYKEDRGGPMGSVYRKPALDAIQAKCGNGWRMIREGEVKGYTSAGMGIIEGTEDESRGRRWGIQFECKANAADPPHEPEAPVQGRAKG